VADDEGLSEKFFLHVVCDESHVVLIQERIDFIKQNEGRALDLAHSEQKGKSSHSFLSPAQLVDVVDRSLSFRTGTESDPSFERSVFIVEEKVGGATERETSLAPG